jgi:hypothetical protein
LSESTLSIEDFKSFVPNQTDPEANWDWTVPFQKLMDSDAYYVLVPSKTYRVNTSNVNKPKRIIGFGAKLLLRGIIAIRSADVTFEGITFDGNNFAHKSNAVVVYISNGLRFYDCKFVNIHKSGIYYEPNYDHKELRVYNCSFNYIGGDQAMAARATQGHALYLQFLTDVVVRDTYISNTLGQAAVTVLRSRDITLNNVTIEDTKWRGIQTSAPDNGPESDVVKNMLIDGCTIRRTGSINTTGDGIATNGIFIRNPRGATEDVKITNCTIEYCGENFIEGTFEATNNTMKFSGAYPNLATPSKEGIYPHARAFLANNKIYDSWREAVKIHGDRKDIILQSNIILRWDVDPLRDPNHPENVGKVIDYLPAIAVQTRYAGDVIDNVLIYDNIVREQEKKMINPIRLIPSAGVIKDTVKVERNATLPFA